MRKLKTHFPIWLVLLLMGGWIAAASASQVLVSQIDNPAPIGATRHHLSQTPNGQLLFSWVEKSDKKTYQLRFAVLEDGEWTEPKTVVTTRHKFASRPVVSSLTDGALGAAWIIRSEGYEEVNLYYARSSDGGKHWSEPLKPYSKKAEIYSVQTSLTPLERGHVALVWNDKRAPKRLQSRAAIVGPKGKVLSKILLDKDVCSCCKIDTVAQGNTLWTAYRDHLPGEVRDIAVVRWNPEGTLQQGLVHNDHWVISGCPSNGPAIDSRNGLTMVTWFTVDDHMSYVRTAFRPEGAKEFKAPIEVDRNANGYVNALLLENGTALVAWRDRAGPKEKLKLARVQPDGTVSHVTTIYHGAFATWPRISMVQIEDSVYVAWSDADQQIHIVKRPVSTRVAME